MKNSLKQNWFKVAILAIIAIFGLYYFVSSSYKQGVNENLNNSISLQTKCADRAALFYKQGGYEDNSGVWSNSYTNHWNKKQEKCFIQVTAISLKSYSFESIDIFDAFEGKHYASFIGHVVCDAVASEHPKPCQLDSGNIWFDANDTRNPADYHVGFQGTAIGSGVGDESTQKEFLNHIQTFMND